MFIFIHPSSRNTCILVITARLLVTNMVNWRHLLCCAYFLNKNWIHFSEFPQEDDLHLTWAYEEGTVEQDASHRCDLMPSLRQPS